jgi:tripartite-type tricarboxylate transporter receptor subunit TctC
MAFWRNLLDQVRQTPEWQEWLERGSQSGMWLTGPALEQFIHEDEAKNRRDFAANGWLPE